MPARHFALILAAVILAAGLTVWALSALPPAALAVALPVLLGLSLGLRLLLRRRG